MRNLISMPSCTPYREVRDDFVRSGDERSWSAILDHWYDHASGRPPEKKAPP